jgi:iron-regulated transporter 1
MQSDGQPAAPTQASTEAPFVPTTIIADASPEVVRQRLAEARWIYASYFFAVWTERMWEFASILYLLQIFPHNLLPASLFGFCEAMGAIVFAPNIGAFLDKHDRLRVLSTSIVGQNVTICIAMSIFAIAIRHMDKWDERIKMGIVAMIISCGVVAKISSCLNKVTINKDWGVVVASRIPKVQSAVNASLRRTDLCCTIVGPIFIGLLSSEVGPFSTSIVIASWAGCSCGIELFLARTIYQRQPALQSKKTAWALFAEAKKKQAEAQKAQEAKKDLTIGNVVGSAVGVATDAGKAVGQAVVAGVGMTVNAVGAAGRAAVSTVVNARENVQKAQAQTMTYIRRMKITVQTYVTHPVFFVSFPYALMSVSVLTLGGTMLAYLKTQGVTDFNLACFRAGGAVIGVIATLIQPRLSPRIGLLPTGVVSMWAHLAALTPVAFLFLIIWEYPTRKHPWFIATMVTCLSCSRLGVFGYDLSETNLMQEMVEWELAGRLNAGQELAVHSCLLICYIMTMVFDDPRHFAFPIFFSYSAIGLATFIVTFHAIQVRRAEAAAKKRVAKPDEMTIKAPVLAGGGVATAAPAPAIVDANKNGESSPPSSPTVKPAAVAAAPAADNPLAKLRPMPTIASQQQAAAEAQNVAAADAEEQRGAPDPLYDNASAPPPAAESPRPNTDSREEDSEANKENRFAI